MRKYIIFALAYLVQFVMFFFTQLKLEILYFGFLGVLFSLYIGFIIICLVWIIHIWYLSLAECSMPNRLLCNLCPFLLLYWGNSDVTVVAESSSLDRAHYLLCWHLWYFCPRLLVLCQKWRRSYDFGMLKLCENDFEL